ncbi:hypothetical protein CL653_01765 [bacterium]|nr:hypothetical protein [bacterium]|tara:strand:+ start:219 stop:593 length:375 start_codon:yes stop_codon:yes gene_type:complete
MYQGNWKCSSCGGTINELPFKPRSDKGLTCRDCFMKQKNTTTTDLSASESVSAPEAPDDSTIATEPSPLPPDELDVATPAVSDNKKTFKGDWQCSLCNSSITELPFEPRSVENLKCIDCFKKSR